MNRTMIACWGGKDLSKARTLLFQPVPCAFSSLKDVEETNSAKEHETCTKIDEKIQQSDAEGTANSQTIDFGFRSVRREQKQNLVRQVFSSVAPSYDIMNDLMSGGLHRLWKDRLVEMLAPFPGTKHIDVAGGTGDVAFRVLRAIQGAEGLQSNNEGSNLRKGGVTVFDINPEMLEEGKKKATSLALDLDRLTWVEGSAEELPFEDNTFDSYTIAFGIRNVTNRQAALNEAYRVIKPGGRFLCLEFSKVTLPGLKEIYDEYSFRVIPEVGKLIAGDAESYRYLVESIRLFPDQEEFKRMIEDARFQMVKYENLTAGIVAIHSGVVGR
jgi:2-methoxy-6-polyprenyl-1,4-benzoquinol methylase